LDDQHDKEHFGFPSLVLVRIAPARAVAIAARELVNSRGDVSMEAVILLAKGTHLRLSAMSRFLKTLAAVAVFSTFSVAGLAQSAVGGQVTHFTDTSMLKPPAGAKVAVIEWEDLECPACAHAFPIVHAAIEHYHIPLVRYDFMIPGHIWSKQAEIYARYMQDTFGMDYATEYRREVFASQFRIASQDDLKQFTTNFLHAHEGKTLPFVLDPKFQREVQADNDLGIKLGLAETPTIVVVTADKGWIQVKDVMQLYAAIDQAEAAEKGATPAVHHTAARH
jgi:protein-disulfide isomerase